VGIRGIGLYLPPIVRHNDWWPAEVVARWQAERAARPVAPPPEQLTEGARRVMAAMAGLAQDPFQGAVARHVMPDDMTVLDMAEHAGRLAIARAGVGASDVDLLLTHTVMPDLLLGNPASQLHHRLGLPRRCFAMETTAAAHSFLMQLTLAEAMIAMGRARLALLVQASAATRSVEPDDPISPLFGDGATAVVVGPVAEGRGLLACTHHADGRYPASLVASVRGGVWSDPGRGVIHVANAAQMRDVFLQTAEVCREAIDATLDSVGLSPQDVEFFAMYQGTPWIRRVVQEHAGLEHARSIDSFAQTGYLFSAILPAGLALADQAGLLADDDLVLAAGGGTGITFGAVVMRWSGR
jgi:3-oxoacyl-[acyl-carrier-protein] synthase III